jgi:hypothetical protein
VWPGRITKIGPLRACWKNGKFTMARRFTIALIGVDDAKQITGFLELTGNKHLRPFPIHWLPDSE